MTNERQIDVIDPNLPYMVTLRASAPLPHCCNSCVSQGFRRTMDRSTQFLDLNPKSSFSSGKKPLFLTGPPALSGCGSFTPQAIKVWTSGPKALRTIVSYWRALWELAYCIAAITFPPRWWHRAPGRDRSGSVGVSRPGGTFMCSRTSPSVRQAPRNTSFHLGLIGFPAGVAKVDSLRSSPISAPESSKGFDIHACITEPRRYPDPP